MDGVADADEDVNGDGKHNIIDCLPENLQAQVTERLQRNIEQVKVTSDSDMQTIKQVDAACPNGEMVIGGGFEVTSASSNWMINVTRSCPLSATTWRVVAEAPSLVKEPWSVTAWAICDVVSE
ncbi:MAG: hypothetical protein R2856_16020 [Caldilineaceae bacterium]